MNDSREFQDIESICRAKLSHVPSQPTAVPSPQSMLSRDQSLRSDTWNLSGTQGNVVGNPRAVIDPSQTPYQGILHSTNQSATGGIPVQWSSGRLVAKGEEQTGSTIPVPIFARRPSTVNSFSPAEIPQNLMAAQQRLQISELHFDKLPTPSTFSCGKITFTTQVSSCSGFPSEAMLWIKEVEMVVDDFESSRSYKGTQFPNFETLDAKIASALTYGKSGNVFANPTASSSSPYSGGFNPWTSVTSEHTSPHEISERQTPVQDDASQDRQPEIQSSIVREDLQRIWGRPTTTADFRSSF